MTSASHHTEPRDYARCIRASKKVRWDIDAYIGAKVLAIGADYALRDQVVLEALVRFSDEELKHQELF
jgi:hypothetical protein